MSGCVSSGSACTASFSVYVCDDDDDGVMEGIDGSGVMEAGSGCSMMVMGDVCDVDVAVDDEASIACVRLMCASM